MGPVMAALSAPGTTRLEHNMSLQAARFYSPKADDTVSAAPWSFGLTLLGIAVAVIIPGAIFPEFFGAGLSQSGLGFH